MPNNDPPKNDPRSFSAFRFLDDFSVAASNVLLDQSRSLLGIWGKLLQGNFKPKELISDAAQFWAKAFDGAVELAALPISVIRNDAEQVPSIVFVIDPTYGAVAAREVPSPVKLKQDVRFDWTGLRPSAPDLPAIDRAYVDVAASASGDSVKVCINDLSRLRPPPGYYVGAIYVVAVHNGPPIRPIALINLFITGPTQQQDIAR